MEYNSVIKKKEQTHAKMWMNLEDITLSAIYKQVTKEQILYDSTYVCYLH